MYITKRKLNRGTILEGAFPYCQDWYCLKPWSVSLHCVFLEKSYKIEEEKFIEKYNQCPSACMNPTATLGNSRINLAQRAFPRAKRDAGLPLLQEDNKCQSSFSLTLL